MKMVDDSFHNVYRRGFYNLACSGGLRTWNILETWLEVAGLH